MSTYDQILRDFRNESYHFLLGKYFHMIKNRKVTETSLRSEDCRFCYCIATLQMRWDTNHDECMIESNNRLNVFNHLKRQMWLSEYKILNVKVNKNM